MSKKQIIIITLAGGVASFVGAFALAWFTKSTPADRSAQTSPTTSAAAEADYDPAKLAASAGFADIRATPMKRTLTEEQLKNLVYELRQKIQQYNDKLNSLELEQQRLITTRNVLKKDIGQLNDLRTELASVVAAVKTERDKLLKSRVEIAEKEKANLLSIAATYDKMEAASAGKILTGMSRGQNAGADDAVKILHYMTERTKAEVLAELAASEPALAAQFCGKLKKIAEEE